ncbi:DMT family transporter [Alishewanella sp. SMS9]|nr:DMT family transporter [Alishewanella sp. SMS9]
MHQITGKTLIGFLLALTTAVLWGILPIALKVLLEVFTTNTITAIRFLFAALMVGVWLGLRGKLPSLALMKQRKIFILMAIAVVGLLLNYSGLLLFFNERLLSLIVQASNETLGVILVIFAAITWAAYALAQKQLLVSYSSKQIMYLIYFAGSIAFIPVSDFTPLGQLSVLQWSLLLFCCLNTVVAYGAFAEALHHWEASKVSAVLAITPLVTIISANIVAAIWPDLLIPQQLNIWSWLGAILVVMGSALTALAPQFVQYREARRVRKLQRDVL